jgi:para-aminobenzoate synthetase/4-amino-4-deoxychorismate lyase
MIDGQTLIVFDFLDHSGKPERWAFNSPISIIAATKLSDVIPAIQSVEMALQNGMYAAGFISYEAASSFDASLKTKAASSFPLVWFGLFDEPGIAADHPNVSCETIWRPELSNAAYLDSFTGLQEAISDGESYQVNYTFRLRSDFEGDPLAYYNHLRESHPSSYSAYIQTSDYAIISNSPELFLSINGSEVVVEPMKGTFPRGRYQEEDDAFGRRLLQSDKDRAEHIMIVDLMRSDLGRIAEIGSVVVSDLFRLQKLPTVWQLTSRITCQKRGDVGLANLLKATFPSGSVTGAPKARTMDLIRDLERSNRNVYCGTIGYLTPSGTGVFNVPIRTVFIDRSNGRAECGVGGGITAGSSVDGEYAEAVAKAKFLNYGAKKFDLLESMLLEEGQFFLLEQHLNRLRDSADFFGFSFDEADIRRRLVTFASETPRGPWKVRLTLARNGETALGREAIMTVKHSKIAIAKTEIDIQTSFVFHKTTNRCMYDEHKRPDVYDVLLWNGDGELTEFTTGNVVAEIDAVLYTPPRECGLLAGTFRQNLIQTGSVIECKLTVKDIYRAKNIWLINSVRRWLPVNLVN